jgi:hypothetical protein
MYITTEELTQSIDIDINYLIEQLKKRKKQGFNEVYLFINDIPAKTFEIGTTTIEDKEKLYITITL